MVRLVPFTAEDVVLEIDYELSPVPELDAHWYRVDRGPGETAGWIRTTGTKPRPSPEKVADELNRLLPRMGVALHGRMVGGRGIWLPLP